MLWPPIEFNRRMISKDGFKSSQIFFIAWKIGKIGEASADTSTTETYYVKGYYDLEETIKLQKSEQRRVIRQMIIIHSFIHSDHFYNASSSPLLLRSTPDTARILCRSFMPKHHRQLWVKDLHVHILVINTVFKMVITLNYSEASLAKLERLGRPQLTQPHKTCAGWNCEYSVCTRIVLAV